MSGLVFVFNTNVEMELQISPLIGLLEVMDPGSLVATGMTPKKGRHAKRVMPVAMQTGIQFTQSKIRSVILVHDTRIRHANHVILDPSVKHWGDVFVFSFPKSFHIKFKSHHAPCSNTQCEALF